VSAWFAGNDATGLTPRQVPIPGVQAKWLNTHRTQVEILGGRPLCLAPNHPARIHFTYVDPAHLAAGGRRFDSATVGDAFRPAYSPDIVLIVENKDTAVHFPDLDGGIVVEGNGFGGSTAAAFDWIIGAPHLLYWGDLDAAGFEILDGFRRDGVPVTSILMDLDTYKTYERWGTNHRPDGTPIRRSEPKDLRELTLAERAVYQLVCTAPGRAPRVEQERVLLAEAADAVRAACL
jgi:hypothetical protein